MKLIIGLGNPGKEYENTRHSVGYMVVDALESQIRNPKSEIRNKFKILKSPNFMNDSGSFVKKAIVNCKQSLPQSGKLKIENLVVVHDDLDIPLGSYKIQFGKGPKDHNGILDIEEKLGTKEFWRVRIGIDNRPLDNKPMGEVYTLEDFTVEEKEILEKVIKEVCKKLATL